ncbi:MAG: WbqC family protein [Bacteroidales bacterium]|nr:WbqC family protein [Bacteroidales bacterium]
MLLSSAYLPPVQYVALLAQRKKAHIEIWEHYVKQSYRNRATILSANGPLDLIMPLEKQQGSKTILKDVKIAYNDRWNAEHWNAIVSAYNSSPFFEYYRDDLEPFFTEKFQFLIDYNQELLQCILKLMQIQAETSFTTDFIPLNSEEEDFRYTISPKKKCSEIIFPEYTQVFEDKFDFFPNLSILDLLCNKGPESKEYLLSIHI